MTRTNRIGFTLVEMLVVIAIIGVLAAMLLPAVQFAREMANNAQCKSQLGQVGKGIIMFANEGAKEGRFPGWRETVGRYTPGAPANDRPWSVAILPYLEAQANYDEFVNLGAGVNPTQVSWLPYYVCPSDAIRFVASDTDLNRRDTSYVGNAGMAGVAGEHFSHGIMHDYSKANPNRVRTRVDDLKDGLTFTALASENSGATRYWDLTPVKAANVFVWFPATPAGSSPARVNEGRELTIPSVSPTNEELARPSSYHTYGVNMVFADGHVRFISQGINYNVYRQLMTPNGQASWKQLGSPAGYSVPAISEADL
ncbi:MAG: DUF1559 domain-containing protein [Pirellulaceae bacterium]